MSVKEYLQSYEKLLRQALNNEVDVLKPLNRKIDIENLIVDIDDPEESQVIRKRYVELKEWDEQKQNNELTDLKAI